MADTIEGLMQEARTFADSRSWDQAIESYSRVLELDADNDEACRNLAQIYALRGMLKSVISTYLRLMHIYVARSDMDNAMAVANYVLLLEPESVDVRSELINMYRYRGDTAEVVARSLDLARLYTELDEGERSIELLQAVLKDDPNNADVCRELAEMYIQYGQVERGANQYHQVADLYQASGQLEKACEALERILVVNSNDSGAVFHLGELYSMLGRWEDAEKQFRSALKFDFENLDVMFALGDVCQRKGDLDQASLAYRKIIMTAPDYVLAQERLGEVYHLQNNIELAIKAYLTAAGLYVNNSDSEHAIALYQRVIFLDPNNPTATRELTNLGAPVVGNDGGIQPLVKAKAAKGAKGESRREKKDGEHKTRSGLVPKGGGGMRAGLMAKGSATKPGLGGKPMLGGDEGEEAPRPGLMRAGLKPMGGGKPTLGGKPMLGGKRVLGSRKKKNETAQVEAKEEHKSVSLAKETEAVVPAEHEIQENHEIEATQATEAHAEPEQAPVAEATEQNDIVPVDENAVLPVNEEDMQHEPSLIGTDVENELNSEAVAQDVAYENYTFEAPQAPQAPAGLSHEEAPVVEQHDNDNIYPSVEGAASVDGEQFGAIETSPEPEVLSHDETNQVPTEHAEQSEYYAGAYDSEASSDELYGVAAPEHAEQLTGTEQLQDASHSATDEHVQFDGLNDSALDNHYADAQVYDHEHDVSIEGAEVANYPETVPQNYPEQGQFDGNEVHDGSYVDPNAQLYDGQHDQFNGTDNYEGAYPEYYEMRPLIMVPEGQLIVPTPILYLERTDLYEAICQAVTEAPDPSVIPWEPLKAVDEVAIEEKMAQQSAEAARAEAEAAAAAQAQAEAAHSQEDFQSVEGFDFNSGINLKGVSETGLRRKHSKGESSGRSSKLMGSQSLSERMARMRAESADTEEAVEHRTISGISRHHQDKPQKKEKGRSIMGGISRPLNQIIEEANQNNGVAVASQETVPEVPRPELTPSRSRSSLSERIKKARQSKAAAKAQSEEMAAVKAEQNFQSTEHAAVTAVTSGEYAATQADEATFAPPAGYEQPIQDQQFNDYQPEAQVQPIEAQPEGEQLMGGYDYQQSEAEAQPVDAQPEGEQLMGGYDYQQPEAQAQHVDAQPEGEQLMGGYDYQQPEAQAQPVDAQPEGEQLMGGYDYEPEAEAQPVDAHPEGEQLMGGYDYQPEAQAQPVDAHPEGEQLMGGYDYEPEAEAQPVDAQHPEGEQLMGGYDYQQPEAETQPVDAQPEDEQLMGGYDYQQPEAETQPVDAQPEDEQLMGGYDYQQPEAEAQPVDVKPSTVVSLAKVADAVEPEAVATVEPTEEAVEPEAVATVEPTEEAVEPEAVAPVEPTEEAVEPEAVATVEPTEEAVEPEAVATVEPTEEAVEPEAVATVEPTEEAVEPEAVAAVEPIEEAVEPEAVATVEPTEEAVEPEAVATVEPTEEAVEPEAVAAVEPTEEAVEPEAVATVEPTEEAVEPEAAATVEPTEEAVEPIDDGLCSLSVESELPPEYLEEAKRLREKLVGADVTTAIGDYRRAIENSPENLVLRTDLADVHLRFSLMDDAINQYRQILRRKPDSVALRHRLACAHLWNEDFDEAVNVYFDLVELHTKNEQYADVIDVLQTILSLDPQNFKARRLLIERFIAQDKIDLAIHHLRQFVDTALSLGSVDNAISALKQLIELSDDPAFVERLAKVYEDHDNVTEAIVYYRILSKRYTQEEKWTDALAICEKLVSLEPDNFDERRLLISLYQNLGRYDKAMAEQFSLAGLYKEQDKVDEAAELYEAIIQKDPNHYEARRCLVDCYLAKGDLAAAMIQAEPLTERYQSERLYAQAIEMYRRLVDADPTSVELREKLLSFYTLDDQRDNMLSELLTLDEIHENKGEYREAVRYLRRAIELAPERAELHCRLARLYDEQLQSVSGAMQEYKKVFELNPGDAAAMSRYAQLLVNQRKPKEAASVLLKLQSVDKEVGKKAIDDICQSFLDKIAQDGADLNTRFSYGELCYHLNRISDAIEQFQKTHVDRDLELRSRNMLGLSFIKMPRMREMAIRQFRLGLDTKGHAEQDYLELRYNLAMLFYQTDRLQEALTEFKSILAFDVTYRDVEARVKDLQAKIAAGGGASKGRGVPPRRK